MDASLESNDTLVLTEAQKIYTNPVLDFDFPDTAILRAPDGFY